MEIQRGTGLVLPLVADSGIPRATEGTAKPQNWVNLPVPSHPRQQGRETGRHFCVQTYRKAAFCIIKRQLRNTRSCSFDKLDL